MTNTLRACLPAECGAMTILASGAPTKNAALQAAVAMKRTCCMP
jgi:hypothetical protein